MSPPLLHVAPRPGVVAMARSVDSGRDMVVPGYAKHAAVTEMNDGGPEIFEADDAEADEDELDAHESMAPELVNEVIIRSGFVYKRGEKRKTWKKRWAVLRASRLALYKNEKVCALANSRSTVC